MYTHAVALANALLTLILEYAVLFGGLVVLEELECLLDTVIDIKPLSDGENTWIDLYIGKSGGSVTANPVASESKLRRWFIDIPLMALMQQFQSLVAAMQDVSTDLTVKAILKQRFQKGTSEGTRLSSVSAVLKTASLVWELDNSDTPGFLSSVVKGHLRSHSLPAHVFAKLYQSKLTKPRRNISEDTQGALNAKNPAHRLEFSDAEFFDFQQDKKRLRELSRLFDFGDRKTSRSLMIDELSSFLAQNVLPSPLLRLMVSWAEFLLRHGSRFKKYLAVNSVRNYISRVGNCWLKYADQNLALDMDELQWEHFYHQVLSSQKGQKSLANLMGRLGEFHHYLAEEWGIEPLPESVFRVNQKNFTVVRSNYINETEFESFCQSLRADFGAMESRMLLSIAVLAYRCGLRKGEIIKLKVSDLNFYNECLIRIRSNEFGNNKSESAYRIIPFHLMATEQEQSIVRDYLALCRELNQNNQNRLLFFLPMTSGSKLTSGYMDDSITSRLKQICRDKTVNFHTLRHAFINNLYIRLFIKEQDWIFAQVNYPKLNLSLSDLAGKAGAESGKALFSIATMAGHASPEETLLSYCHLLDVHQKHCSNPLPIEDVEILSALLNMRTDTYVRFYQRNKDNLPAALSKKLVREWTTNYGEGEEKLTLIKPDSKAAKAKMPSEGGIQESTIDVAAITLLLNAWDKGNSITEIAKATGYHDTQVAKVVNVATNLANIKTAKGQSRLISQNRKSKAIDQNGEPRMPIAPLLPREARLKTDALKIVEKGNKILGSGKAQRQFKEALDYYVNNVVTTKPGISLDSPKSALMMINLFNRITSHSRIYTFAQPSSSEQFVSTNQLLLDKQISFHGDTLFIDRLKPHLCVNHPTPKENQFKNASSLHFALHVLSILSRVKELI